MLRITIEMLPGGQEEGKYVMATGIIKNDGTGDKMRGNYKWYFQNRSRRSLRKGRVTGFQRRSRGPISLLMMVLEDYFKEEKAKDA